MKTLHLTLSKLPFDVMVTGEKTLEFRKPTKWIQSRLNRVYGSVKFTNGYGKDKPYFIAEFKGFIIRQTDEVKKYNYSNGLNVTIEKGDYTIILGEITERGNIK